MSLLALKCKLDEINCQQDLTLQCVRSTLDGLTCINRSIHVIYTQEDKENQYFDEESTDSIEENLDENISLVLLSRLNDICMKLAKNVDSLVRTPLPPKVAHPVQRHESNASSISKPSGEELNDTSGIVYEELIEKLNQDLDEMKTRLAEQEHRT